MDKFAKELKRSILSLLKLWPVLILFICAEIAKGEPVLPVLLKTAGIVGIITWYYSEVAIEYKKLKTEEEVKRNEKNNKIF